MGTIPRANARLAASLAGEHGREDRQKPGTGTSPGKAVQRPAQGISPQGQGDGDPAVRQKPVGHPGQGERRVMHRPRLPGKARQARRAGEGTLQGGQKPVHTFRIFRNRLPGPGLGQKDLSQKPQLDRGPGHRPDVPGGGEPLGLHPVVQVAAPLEVEDPHPGGQKGQEHGRPKGQVQLGRDPGPDNSKRTHGGGSQQRHFPEK